MAPAPKKIIRRRTYNRVFLKADELQQLASAYAGLSTKLPMMVRIQAAMVTLPAERRRPIKTAKTAQSCFNQFEGFLPANCELSSVVPVTLPVSRAIEAPEQQSLNLTLTIFKPDGSVKLLWTLEAGEKLEIQN